MLEVGHFNAGLPFYLGERIPLLEVPREEGFEDPASLALTVTDPSGKVIVADLALMTRALREERVLKADGAYEAYCRRVAWHVVPGVF